MVSRKGGLSGKQKAALLKQKRHEKSDAGAASHEPQQAKHMVQQVSRKGDINTLSTAFVREDNEIVLARRLRGSEPMRQIKEPLRAAESVVGSLGMPQRPEPQPGRSANAQEDLEAKHFQQWLDKIHAEFGVDSLSPFEHNLEVWRQLWRVIERSDVICARR